MTRRPAAAVPDRAWARRQRAARRWALWGGLLGTTIGAVAFAPAAWLADRVHRASGERLLLADARGSVWSGHAVAVLQGGPGSRDASALPGRLHWRLTPTWSGLRLTLRQACCLTAPLRIDVRPGWAGVSVQVPARPEGIGQWPARWLEGLGTPWNTLQLGGMLQLASTGFTVQTVQGRTRFDGAVELGLIGASSRLSSIQPLGSYLVSVRGDGAGADSASLSLSTVDGALRLSGSGQWSGAGLRFRGEARAAQGQDAGLANLLNIIGRRQGALSVLSIG